MFRSISFCVGNKTVEVNGQEFPVGELSTEVLNIAPDEYSELAAIAQRAARRMAKYQRRHNMGDWFAANEEYIRLDGLLCRHRIFRLIREEPEILQEARQFTEQYSLFPEDDCAPGPHDDEVFMRIAEYKLYLEHPEEYAGMETTFIDADGNPYVLQTEPPPVPPIPPEKTRALLIYPGDIETKWEFYKKYCDRFEEILFDLSSFNTTIQNFINIFLSNLKTLDANNYAAALSDFLYNERAEKLVAGPFNDAGHYSVSDTVELYHIPRETSPGSGEYKIYAYYEVEALQAFLKMDFYKALEAGYTIRRCIRCKRYFLLKNARHTKYCDWPDLKNPRYTCAQMGYHTKGVKEKADDNPRAGSLQRCYLRINKDLSRGIITEREKRLLYGKAKDLYHEAETTPGISYDAFEASLASKNLYSLCGITRRARPRGRPKKT